MSIGFSFTAKANRAEDLIRAAGELAGQGGYDMGNDGEGLWVSFCPMGVLRMDWEQDGEALAVSGQCATTPAGAGFHRAALEFVEALAETAFTDLAVNDETDYARHRDFERMKGEHFYPWLNTLVKVCLERSEAGEYSCLNLCWDMDQYQPEEVPGTAVTPMGRFDIAAMGEAVKTQGIKWLADRFFIWDQPLKDARYHRNCALNRLWEDCCFAPSGRSDEDKRCNQAILRDLERAAALDPSLPLPLAAYREVCALDGRRPAIPETAPEFTCGFPIGFRRGEVTHAFGVLRLTLPGSYRGEWEENEGGGNGGCDLWWDASVQSPIWRLNGFRKRSGTAEITHPFEEEQDQEQIELTDGAARWGWYRVEEDGDAYYQVFCEAVSGPSLFIISVTYSRPEEREGIYRLLRKLAAVKERTPRE